MRIEVLFLTLPDAQLQGVAFACLSTWDVPLLDGYPLASGKTFNPERAESSIPSSLLAKGPMAEFGLWPRAGDA